VLTYVPTVLRSTLIWASRRGGIGQLLEQQPLLSRAVRRFIAGETTDETVEAVRRLQARGLFTTVDHLGEAVRSVADARAAADECCAALRSLAAAGVDRNISVKLTQLGIEIAEELCLENLRAVAAKARQLGAFVRIDMEASRLTDAALRAFEAARSVYPGFGVVLQAYLHRTPDDLARLIATGTRIRLCKGAYDESPSVALRTKEEVDRRYRELMIRMLDRATYPAIATHDEALIDTACRYAAERAIPPDRFEFQMLYGVRRDLQTRLVELGYRVRVYVPYGPDWFAYFMRRLAERPANIVFVLSSLVRERRSHAIVH
jgi:proline dehydrogenase